MKSPKIAYVSVGGGGGGCRGRTELFKGCNFWTPQKKINIRKCCMKINLLFLYVFSVNANNAGSIYIVCICVCVAFFNM